MRWLFLFAIKQQTHRQSVTSKKKTKNVGIHTFGCRVEPHSAAPNSELAIDSYQSYIVNVSHT